MARVSEHLTKEEIEEKIAVLVREHRAADPRISALAIDLRVSFWLMVFFTSTAIAAWLVVLLRG